MTDLLRANVFRLRRDRTFWVCIAAVLALSAGMMVVWGREHLARGLGDGLEYYYFQATMLLGLFQSVFGVLFLNTEYSDGTVRNKLSVGYTRREVYLAHFLTILLASILILLAWAIGGCAGIPFMGTWRISFWKLALYILLTAAFSTVFAALVTFIGVVCTGRAATVAAVLVYFALLMATMSVYSALAEPEFVGGILMTIDGMQEMNPEPNPNYLTGMERMVYEFLMDLSPIGQAEQVQSLEQAHPVRALICDAAETLALTLGGLALFRKKDLK